MDKQYSQLGRHSNWLRDTPCSARQSPEYLQQIVNDKGSLTAALIQASNGSFEVNLLRHTIAVPYFHEQMKLGRSLHKAAMIREVELLIHKQAVVYARSIIPLKLISRGKNGLANLGGKPLGQLLFKDGKIRVSKREFAFIEVQNKTITARRTPYEYEGSTILVSEFFLPAIQDYC